MGCAPEGVPVELDPVPAGQACVRSGDRREGAALPGGPVLQPGPDGERLLILKSSLFCLSLPGPRFAPMATPGPMPEPGLRQRGREARGHPGRGLTDGPRDSLGPSVCLILAASVFISSSLCVYKAQAMRCAGTMPEGNPPRPGTAPGRPCRPCSQTALKSRGVVWDTPVWRGRARGPQATARRTCPAPVRSPPPIAPSRPPWELPHPAGSLLSWVTHTVVGCFDILLAPLYRVRLIAASRYLS